MPRFYNGYGARQGGVPWQQPQQQDNTGALIAAVLQMGPLADERTALQNLSAAVTALPQAPSTVPGDAADQLNKLKPFLKDAADKGATRSGQSRTGILLGMILGNSGGGGNNNSTLAIALLASNGGL